MIPHYDILEARRLLAGVTLLTHGLNGDIDGWVETAAADIAERAGGATRASIYSMEVEASGGTLTVTSFGPDSGESDYRETLDGEMILKLDWGSVSGGSYPTGDVAAVVSAYLLSTHGG
ncbi:MAG: hypothetical protein H7144_05970, partial [Burkholderiales bacterium]|nr:hypothetical protein [Phycisphaerae bacterium]